MVLHTQLQNAKLKLDKKNEQPEDEHDPTKQNKGPVRKTYQ